jgi:hypothetical protein
MDQRLPFAIPHGYLSSFTRRPLVKSLQGRFCPSGERRKPCTLSQLLQQVAGFSASKQFQELNGSALLQQRRWTLEGKCLH